MNAIEMINKMIEQDEAEYSRIMDKMELPENCEDGILARDAIYLTGSINGMKLAVMVIEGSK